MIKNKKIIMIIQARLGSKRLPRKAILPLVNKLSILEFLINRLKLVKRVDDIFLATSNRKENDLLVRIAKKLKINFHRGSEHNVIKRFYDISKNENADIIIRICADNPLIDPFFIDRLILKFINNSHFGHLSTYHKPSVPYGSGCAIFNFETLHYIYEKYKNDKITLEHVEPRMLSSKKIKTYFFKTDDPRMHLPNLNLSIDNYWNYEYVKGLSQYLYNKYNYQFSIKEIVNTVTKPKIGIFANGLLGKKALMFFKSLNLKFEFIVHHPTEKAYLLKDIIKISKIKKERLFSYDKIVSNPRLLDKFDPLIGFSFWSSFIIPKSILNKFPLGIYNLHNSVLPSLRGSGANIWSILKEIKPGASLHKIDEKIDKGYLIEYKEFNISFMDDGYSLFIKQHKAMINLLKKNFYKLLYGNHRYIHSPYQDSFYTKAERDKFKLIKYNDYSRAKSFFNILRAYQFSSSDSAIYLDEENKKWSISIKIKKY